MAEQPGSPPANGGAHRWDISATTSSPGQTVQGGGPTTHQGPVKIRPVYRACEQCSKSKVKCEWSEGPSCLRCIKAEKECTPRETRDEIPKKRRRLSSSVHLENPLTPLRSTGQGDDPNRRTSTSVAIHSATSNPYRAPSELHPGHSTSSRDALVGSDRGHERSQPLNADKQAKARHRGQEVFLSITGHVNSTSGDVGIDIPRRDLRGMINIFCEKILPAIPVLSMNEFRDADHLIDTNFPLVCCICYVTARYLPGGKELRHTLRPKVAQVLRGKSTSSSEHDNQISMLKALIILYSYANTSALIIEDQQDSQTDEILYWPLKALVEVYALRYSLHNAIHGLLEEVARTQNMSQSTDTISYQKYVLWLQLFILAKHTSVLSGTPTTIPLDSSIRKAPDLIKDIGMTPQAYLFAQVEIALIWEQIGSRGELGEWWCSRGLFKFPSDNETEVLLREADEMIDLWYEKWTAYINNEDDNRGGMLDFYGRCTRFWINDYATKHIRRLSSKLSAVQKHQVRTSVKYASDVLGWPLDLSPFQKDSLRYIPESSASIVSYCCLFILASCETFGSDIPGLYSSVEKVSAAALLMLNMAPDTNHTAHVHGQQILKRADAFKKYSINAEQDLLNKTSSTHRGSPRRSSSYSGIGTLESELLYQRNTGEETSKVWDFAILTPRMW